MKTAWTCDTEGKEPIPFVWCHSTKASHFGNTASLINNALGFTVKVLLYFHSGTFRASYRVSSGDISDSLDEAVIAAGVLLSFWWNTHNMVIACSWSLTSALISKAWLECDSGNRTEIRTTFSPDVVKQPKHCYLAFKCCSCSTIGGKTHAQQLASHDCGFYTFKTDSSMVSGMVKVL